MTVTLNTLIYSFSSLHLPIFRPQDAIVSEKYKVLTLSHTKVYENKFDLGLKYKFTSEPKAQAS